MFEIFSIGKLDVFSSKDAGLRLAMNNTSMVKPESDWKNMMNMQRSGHLIRLSLQYISEIRGLKLTI